MQTKQHTGVFRFTPVSLKVKEIFGIDPTPTDGFPGIPSGFHYLDRTTGGFQNATLTTIAVRQGMGKTAMLLSLIANMALRGHLKLAVFSLERHADKLVRRLVESETGTSVDKIIQQDFKDKEKIRIHQVLRDLAGSSIMIDDTQAASLEEIIHHIDLLAETHKPDLIFIDYLDLIKRPVVETENCMPYERIMRVLSQTARDHALPIVLFHQICQPYNPLNDGFRLQITDIPGDITNYSDSVYLLQRDDCMGSAQSIAEINIVKHPTISEAKTITLHFIESTDRFIDFE